MKQIQLTVKDMMQINVVPVREYEYVISTREVARGYGVGERNIRKHLLEHKGDLIEGKHFIKGGTISSTLGDNAQPHQIFWTKRGVIRLGFLIKSDRARIFRDWAEDLVIAEAEASADEYNAYLAELVEHAAAIVGNRARLARRTGFSEGTLSDVCHTDRRITPDTRRRIEAACLEVVNSDRLSPAPSEAISRIELSRIWADLSEIEDGKLRRRLSKRFHDAIERIEYVFDLQKQFLTRHDKQTPLKPTR
jgi:DNA-binding transcriptional regulator YdaS (Cro superfamily)